MDFYEFDIDEFMDMLGEEIDDPKKHEFADVISFHSAVNRNIFIGSIVEGLGSSTENVIRFWNDWDNNKNIPVEKREPIKIYIDSNGGSLRDVFTIIDAIKLSKTPVWTIVTGAAYSGGFFIAMAGHKRFCYKTATFLFHEGSTGNSGDAGKFRNYAAFYNREMEVLKQLVLENTKLTEDWYKNHQNDDYWMFAEEAVESGIIDEILKEFV